MYISHCSEHEDSLLIFGITKAYKRMKGKIDFCHAKTEFLNLSLVIFLMFCYDFGFFIFIFL